MADQSNKAHHKRKEKKTPQGDGHQNPKAYTFTSAVRAERQAARSHDIKEKRLHVPLVDRLPEEAPPLVVGVVGPPQVGKTTLIKSLIRRYTKQTISNPSGPLTVVTSKRRRLTFLECPSDSLASMIDVAKIVDIVLLMIDGKYGFEMETMEFLNVLSASGMPGNVFGILTKLDLFKKQETLKTQKKRLKHRFWSELYQGAKLFYLSGVVNGRYPDREILNLSRFLSVMKNPRPLVWRNSHPYCLADRFLDLTPPLEIENNPKCDRTISLYGYLRGTNFPAQNAQVHVPGVGDLDVADIEALPDPCPTPYMKQAEEKITGKQSRKRLGEKQKVLFAPMSDVGGVLVDKDAVYIDVKTSTFDENDLDYHQRGLGEQLVMGLHKDKRKQQDVNAGVRLFGNTRHEVLSESEGDSQNLSGDQDSDDDDFDEQINGGRDNLGINGSRTGLNAHILGNEVDDKYDRNDVAFVDGDSDDDSISSSGLAKINAASADEWSLDELSAEEDTEDEINQTLTEHGQAGFLTEGKNSKSTQRTSDLSRLVYNLSLTPKDVATRWMGTKADNDEIQNATLDKDEFFKIKPTQAIGDREEERIPSSYDYSQLEAKWTIPENIAMLREKFLTNRLGHQSMDGDDENSLSNNELQELSEDEGDGEFEDLETGEFQAGAQPESQEISLEAEREKNAKKKEELRLRFEEEDKEGFANPNTKDKIAAGEEEFGEDQWYDAQKAKLQTQLNINRAEFEQLDENSRVRVEGYRAGTYARITLRQVPFEFAANFDPRYPLIIGGINPTENRFGFIQVRIKRHRWHQKILKTNDPLIFSLGWRRFQTVPVYSLSDSRTRNRLLKYTPEHMHCFGTFYGPLVAPNTGFCCVQSFSNNNTGFRIAATGVVLNVDESVDIVKKLKIKGHPHKVFKNTAILKDMFGSDLEIAKFKSGTLRTVSGIRGMIKGRAGHQYPEGYARAGFEDKILMSDIVFLSTWTLIKPKQFYVPVTNLLMSDKRGKASSQEQQGLDDDETASDVKGRHDWQGMRLTSQVRHSLDLPTPSNPDSSYRSIDRPARHFNPLRVPRKLQADLPFKSKIAQMKPQRQQTYLQRRAVVLGGEEKKARDLMQKIMTLRNEKAAKRAAAQEQRKEPYRRQAAENLEKKEAREKREKDEFWRREGRRLGKRAAEGDIGGNRGKKKAK